MTPGKIVTAAIILLFLIIGAGLYSVRILDTSSGKIRKQIEMVESDAKSGKWASALKRLSNAEKDWSAAKKTWSVLLDHIEIDNIDTSIARLKNYVESNDKALVLGESANLLQFIEHIPDKEVFNLKNIL